MPYTPPSHNSPASSKAPSPAISRSPSWSEDGPLSPITGRPQLPRSVSSASYLSRHRRSPSFSKPAPVHASAAQPADSAFSPSLRQSPPPVNNLVIPTGAIISPPDSSENSDGDEGHGQGRERGRELEIRKLQEAVRSIDLKRDSSPDRAGAHISTSAPTLQTVSPSALTPEARKISHSRSATETAIIFPRDHSPSESQTNTSDDSDDDAPTSKPSLVRKKSGELVKPALRPSSRRRYSSMPGTPTYSKSVHFNDSDNQTRHFLQVDKPIAVSVGSSPVEIYESETEYPFDNERSKPEREIKLTNFPAEETLERKTKPIRVERIFLSADKNTLIGTCAAQNISFHKLVVARFTLDYWKTTSEVVAEYNNDPRNPNPDGCDRFNFHIKLSDQANIDNKTLLLCVRYAVGGQEFWDNNNHLNFQVDFTKVVKKHVRAPMASDQIDGRPHQMIPRSRHSPSSLPLGRGGQELVDDEFGARSNSTSAYQFSSANDVLGESPRLIKLKPKTKPGTAVPGAQSHQTSNNLGGRYDFGASLSAALSNAQDKLGRSSGLMNAANNKSSGSYFPHERKQGPTASSSDKPHFAGDRPAMGSDQYRDLVQKFCYVGSSTTSTASTTTPTNTPPTASKRHTPATSAVA